MYYLRSGMSGLRFAIAFPVSPARPAAKFWARFAHRLRVRNSASPRAYGQTFRRRLPQHDQRYRRASSAVRRRQKTLAIEAIQATKLEIQIEAQANASASFLLMPLD